MTFPVHYRPQATTSRWKVEQNPQRRIKRLSSRITPLWACSKAIRTRRNSRTPFDAHSGGTRLRWWDHPGQRVPSGEHSWPRHAVLACLGCVQRAPRRDTPSPAPSLTAPLALGQAPVPSTPNLTAISSSPFGHLTTLPFNPKRQGLAHFSPWTHPVG